MPPRNSSPRASATPALPAPPPAAGGPSLPPPVPPEARKRKRGRGRGATPPPLPNSKAPGDLEVPSEPALLRAQAQVAEYLADLKRERDGARQCRLHAELGRLYERPLFDFEAAEKHYREAIRRRSEHLAGRQGLRRVLASQGQYAKVLQHLEAELELLTDGQARAGLWFEKGLILEAHLQRPQAALTAYEEAIALAPAHAPALEGIARLSSAAGDLSRAERALAQAAHLAPPEEQAALLCAQARLLEVASDDARATDAYQRAWDADRDCAVARQALQRLLLNAGRYETLADVMTAEIEHCSEPGRKAVLLTHLAHLQAQRLDQPDAALATLAQARALLPDDATILSLATRLCEGPGQEQELLEHLEALAAVTQDEALRVSTLVRMGELCLGPVGDDDGARRWFEAALEVAPLQRTALRGLETLHRRRGDHYALIRLWTARATAEPSTSARTSWLARAGRLLADQGEHEEAARCYREALALAPGDRALQLALERIYRAAGDHEALLSLYRAAVDDPQAEVARRVDMLLQIAQLEEGPANRPDPAIDAYRQLLTLDPSHRLAATSLERLALANGRFDVLEQCLVHQADQARDPASRAELLSRSAEVLEKELRSHDRAEARYRDALEADAGHLPALLALERLYRRAGHYASVLDVGERQLGLLGQPDQRAALLLDLAEVAREHLGDATTALSLIQRAKDEAPDHPGVRESLTRALEAAGQHRELGRMWYAELGAIGDPEARAQAEFRLGQLRELRLADSETAARCYDAAIGYDPGHEGAWEGLCRTQARLGRDKELAEALVRRAEASKDEGLQNQYYLRAAWLYAERLQKPTRALACLEQCAPPEAQTPDRLRLLADLAAKTGASALIQAANEAAAAVTRSDEGRFRALWELERAARIGGDGQHRAERLSQLRQLAPMDRAVIDAQLEEAASRRDWVALTRLDAELSQQAGAPPAEAATAAVRHAEALEEAHPADALRSYRRALEADPESLGAARGLARLAQTMEDPALLMEAADHEGRTGGDASRMATLEAAAGRLWQAQGKSEEAADALERALSHDPNGIGVVDGLCQLLAEAGQVLRLLDLLRNAAERASEVAARRVLWLRVGRLQESAFENVAGALTATQQAMRADPTHRPTLLRLAQLHRQNQQWDEAIKLLQRAVTVPGDEPSLLAAYLDLAALYEEQLDDESRAISYLEAARALDGERAEVAERLARLYGQAGDHAAALQAANALVSRAHDDPTRASAQLALARAKAAAGEDGVTQALSEALRIQGPGGAAAKAFHRHLRDQPQALFAYVKALSAYEDDAPPERAREAALEIARAHRDLGNDPEAASEHLARALQRDDCPDLHQALGELELAGGDPQAALVHADAIITAAPWRAAAVRLWVDAQQAREREDRAAEGAAVLMVLGTATDADKALLLNAEADNAERPVSRETLEHMTRSSPVGQAAEALLRALRPAWAKLYPANLDDYGLASHDRLAPDHPLSEMARGMAARLGVERFELYLNPARGQDVRVELAEPIKLMLPMAILDLPEGQQRHVLAKPLVALSLGLEPLLKLTARELQILLASACRPIEKSAGAGLTSEDELAQQARAIGKALGRRARKEAEKLARTYMEVGAKGLGTWPDERLVGFERAAAKVSGNLPLVVQYWQRWRKSLRDLPGARAVEADQEIADAIRLWLSSGSEEGHLNTDR